MSQKNLLVLDEPVGFSDFEIYMIYTFT